MNDKDQQPILEKEQYNIIYKLSYIHVLSSVYGYMYQPSSLSLFNLSSTLTSVTYWYLPLNNWRRYLDIVVVNSNMIYNLYSAYYSIYGYYYYLIILGVATSFGISHYYYYKHDYWTSTLFHILVHLYGFMGNMILFSGNIL